MDLRLTTLLGDLDAAAARLNRLLELEPLLNLLAEYECEVLDHPPELNSNEIRSSFAGYLGDLSLRFAAAIKTAEERVLANRFSSLDHVEAETALCN